MGRCGAAAAFAVVTAAVLFVPYLQCPSAHSLQCCMLGSGCPSVAAPHGYVAPGWERVMSALFALLREGHELGAQVVVYHKGELVVDIAGGTALPLGIDGGPLPGERVRLQRTHLAPVFSSGKVAESLVIASLADKGLLEYDAPIARYWPEFAQNGKGGVTVQQLMRHQGGLCVPGNGPVDPALMQPGRESEFASFLGSLPLNWAPDTVAQHPRQVYHAITRGWFVTELTRRVDPSGRTAAQYFDEELAAPLGLNFTFGTRSAVPLRSGRAVRVEESPRQLAKILSQHLVPDMLLRPFLKDFDRLFDYEVRTGRSLALGLLRNQELPLWVHGLTKVVAGARALPDYQRAELMLSDWMTSASAVTNARGLGRLAAAMAEKGALEGARVLSEKGYAAAEAGGPRCVDEVFGYNISYSACGWGRDRFEPHGITGFVGWAGASGSVVQWSPSRRMAYAYVPVLAYPRVARVRSVRLLRAVLQSAQELAAGGVPARMRLATETEQTHELLREQDRKQAAFAKEQQRFRREQERIRRGDGLGREGADAAGAAG
eukprot:TRINITY_DN33584_c0_g1_i1.p1 TRINITY_DN33584_c0_g1~~TRINITY_DN33584_c0_g1_i1.p1  ORF type:complete len:547 (+),score=124.57 TRINITY_DN33584_c0_g1_i1:67-1707(+)